MKSRANAVNKIYLFGLDVGFVSVIFRFESFTSSLFKPFILTELVLGFGDDIYGMFSLQKNTSKSIP